MTYEPIQPKKVYNPPKGCATCRYLVGCQCAWEGRRNSRDDFDDIGNCIGWIYWGGEI